MLARVAAYALKTCMMAFCGFTIAFYACEEEWSAGADLANNGIFHLQPGSGFLIRLARTQEREGSNGDQA